ncbi:M28 family peptidase [bacterium]|nr:M28 family peptidase [bacterium]
MAKPVVLVLFLILAQQTMAQEKPPVLEAQKMIVAELSGHRIPKDGRLIAHRSTKEERQLTRDYLSNLIISIGLIPELQEYTLPNVNPLLDLLLEPYKGANVYTTLPSTTKSEDYIVIGAHFDTERNFPGAIDNASGIAIGYGVLRKLSTLQSRDANIILVYFDQEEEDLVGSQAFAQKLEKEEFNVLSVHSIDTMGWDRDGDKTVELDLPTDYLKDTYTKVGAQLNIPIFTSKVSSSDHFSFIELGFNAVGLTDELVNGDYAPYKDTPKDTYDTVNFYYIASTTELIYEVFKELMKE